jgi:hypothetical protein
MCAAVKVRLLRIRCQDTTSEDGEHLCVCVTMNCNVCRLAIALYCLQLRVECISTINTIIQSPSSSHTPKIRVAIQFLHPGIPIGAQ